MEITAVSMPERPIIEHIKLSTGRAADLLAGPVGLLFSGQQVTSQSLRRLKFWNIGLRPVRPTGVTPVDSNRSLRYFANS